MEIIRARLCDSDYFRGENYFHKMAKTCSKGDCIDIQPCRAKRKLFEEPPSHHEDSSKRTGETVRSLRHQNEGELLDNKFSNIEVFEQPPHPYRTVTHSPRCVTRLDQTVGETGTSDRVIASSSQTVSQSPPRSSQTRLQDYFKPKKRPRLSAAQQQKTPVTTRQRKAESSVKKRAPRSGDGL